MIKRPLLLVTALGAGSNVASAGSGVESVCSAWRGTY